MAAGAVLAVGHEPTRGGMAIADTTQSAQERLPPGTLRLQLVEIIDSQGFEKPLPAATALIPYDWRAQGGVVWDVQSPCGDGYSFRWRAESPDGAKAAEILPGLQWGFNNFGGQPSPGCPALQITTARQYLEYQVRKSRPQARILDFRVREDLLNDYASLNSHTPMPMGEMRTWVEAGEVLLGYNEQGREIREAAAAVVLFTTSRMQGVQPGQTMDSFSAVALPGYAFRSPAGQLDFHLAEMIRRSFRIAPEWQQRISAHQSAINRTALAESRKRSEIIARTGEEIRELNQRGWEERNHSSDRQRRGFIEAIRDVETYNDPHSGTGQIELSNQYDNAYRLNDGSYVLTNDPSFNPYQATGQDGVKLERRR